MIVWPDTGDENWPAYAEERWPELGLIAITIVGDGDQAVATEDAWRAYQLANAANDRNGSYNVESINIGRDGMAYQWDYRRDDGDPDVVFPRVEGNAPDGSPLYLFPGPWVVNS